MRNELRAEWPSNRAVEFVRVQRVGFAVFAMLLASLLLALPTAWAARTAPNEAELVSVGGDAQLTIDKVKFRRKKGEWKARVSIRNLSDVIMRGPMFVTVGDVEPTTSAALRYDGVIDGKPAYAVRGKKLRPGKTTRLVIALRGDAGGEPTFTPELYVHTSIAQLELGGAPKLQVTNLDAVTIAATATSGDGDTSDVREDLEWSSSDSSVATVEPGGVVRPLGEGVTTIAARLPSEWITRSMRLVVAPARDSGSVLLAATGGLVRSDGASVYVPPGALTGDSEVTLGDALSVDQLSAPLPDGMQFVAGVVVTAGDQSLFGVPLTVSVEATGAGGSEVARVLTRDAECGVWKHSGWAQANSDGSVVSFDTSHLSEFCVVQAAVEIAQLATRYAPRLVISDDDVHPISMDDLLSECELHEVVEVPPKRKKKRKKRKPKRTTQLVEASPTVADLLSPDNDSATRCIALNGDARAEFDAATWSGARLGGRARGDAFDATVHWRACVSDGHVVLQYWMLYAMSGEPFFAAGNGYDVRHEGDLELFQVILDRGELPRPVAATASQHYFGEGRSWADVDVGPDGRPVVFVAEAGHATFFEPRFEGDECLDGGGGTEGFRWKPNALGCGAVSGDRAPVQGNSATLVVGEDYALTYLDPDANDATTALLRWKGLIGRWEPSSDKLHESGPPAVAYRHPDEPDLGIADHALDFHRAYAFSTSTAINAYEDVGPEGAAARVQLGAALLGLHGALAGRYHLDRMQPLIDEAAGSARAPDNLVALLESVDLEQANDDYVVELTALRPLRAYWPPTRRTDDDTYYALITAPRALSWDEADAWARDLNWEGRPGRLASISSPADLEWVRISLLGNALTGDADFDAARRQAYYVGGVQDEEAGDRGDGWRWESGESWSPWADDNWAQGRPSHDGPSRLALAGPDASEPWTWIDVDSGEVGQRGYIVAFAPPPVSLTAMVITYADEDDWGTSTLSTVDLGSGAVAAIPNDLPNIVPILQGLHTLDASTKTLYFVGADLTEDPDLFGTPRRIYSVDVATGSLVSNPVFDEGVAFPTCMEFDAATGQVFGTAYFADGPEDGASRLARIDPATGAIVELESDLPDLVYVQSFLSAYDSAKRVLFVTGFETFDDPSFTLYSVDVATGDVLSASVLDWGGEDYHPTALQFDSTSGLLVGTAYLLDGESGSGSYLVTVDPATGDYTRIDSDLPPILPVNGSAYNSETGVLVIYGASIEDEGEWGLPRRLYSVDIGTGEVLSSPIISSDYLRDILLLEF